MELNPTLRPCFYARWTAPVGSGGNKVFAKNNSKLSHLCSLMPMLFSWERRHSYYCLPLGGLRPDSLCCTAKTLPVPLSAPDVDTPLSLSQLLARVCCCLSPLHPPCRKALHPALLWWVLMLFPTGIWTRWNEPWLQENWFWLKTWRNRWIQFWGHYWGEKQSRKEGDLRGGLMACVNGSFVLLCFLFLT